MDRFHDQEGFAAMVASSRASSSQSSAKSTPPLNDKISILEAVTAAAQRRRMKWLMTPCSLYGKRIRYAIMEYERLLDSSDMNMEDWVRIATDIEVNYKFFDAFIVLHGTDTMAYTASALSFLLENLGKTVIITGSQVPISEVRNDGIDNLLGALTIAGHFVIPEVTLYFNNRLFRGNRCSKLSAMDFDAFDSPNLPPLVNVGVSISTLSLVC
jgi:lysophospholipase